VPLVDFQRAPQAPLLPTTTFRSICHFAAQFRYWYLAMVVAHRLSTIAHLDRSLVFDPGRIVDQSDAFLRDEPVAPEPGFSPAAGRPIA
jgi:hypothetical protein